MSFKAVKELRTTGKLEEALVMAIADLEADATNVWNIRSISWVYYEYIKINATLENYDTFLTYIQKTMDLGIEGDDAIMLHENVAIQIGRMVYAVYKEQVVDFSKIDHLFELSKKLIIGKPSNANSFLIKSFVKGGKNWSNTINFIDYFGFDSFQESDFKSEEFNGRAISSTVEKFYNAYAKKLIDSSKDIMTNKEEFQTRVNLFLPRLDTQILKNPEFQFLPYFKAKLLISIGQKQEVLTAFLPFAKRKKNEFWVWEVIAEIFTKNDENNFACHCKALSLSSPEEYLVGLRKDFAEMLISRGLLAEAKYEIKRLVEVRTKKGWKIPNDVLTIMNLSWYSETKENKDNIIFYSQYVSKAEEILFHDIQEEIIVIEFVNFDKQILNFVKDESKHGFFSFKTLIQKPKIGDLYSVRFNGGGSDGFYKVLSLKIANENVKSEAVKSFEGNIRIKDGSEFGFVNDVFIEPNLLKRNKFLNNQEVSGKALRSFNKKKNEWGWKMF